MSPFQLVHGYEMPGPGEINELPPGDPPNYTDKVRLAWFKRLTMTLDVMHENRVQQRQPKKNPGHKEVWFKTGDQVFIKRFTRRWPQSRWEGPFKIERQTEHSIKVEGKKLWYHKSQTKPLNATQSHRSLEEIEKELAELNREAEIEEQEVARERAIGETMSTT